MVFAPYLGQRWVHYSVVEIYFYNTKMGSGALYSEMLLVGIVENDKIDAYFRVKKVK